MFNIIQLWKLKESVATDDEGKKLFALGEYPPYLRNTDVKQLPSMALDVKSLTPSRVKLIV